MAAVFDLIWAPPRVVAHQRGILPRGLARPQAGATALGCAWGTPIPPQLEQIMRQAYQTPFAPDLRQTTQQEATEPPDFFALTTHRCHDDLASGVEGLAVRRPHFRGHPLLRRGRRRARLGRRGMVLLAPRGSVGI